MSHYYRCISILLLILTSAVSVVRTTGHARCVSAHRWSRTGHDRGARTAVDARCHQDDDDRRTDV